MKSNNVVIRLVSKYSDIKEVYTSSLIKLDSLVNLSKTTFKEILNNSECLSYLTIKYPELLQQDVHSFTIETIHNLCNEFKVFKSIKNTLDFIYNIIRDCIKLNNDCEKLSNDLDKLKNSINTKIKSNVKEGSKWILLGEPVMILSISRNNGILLSNGKIFDNIDTFSDAALYSIVKEYEYMK